MSALSPINAVLRMLIKTRAMTSQGLSMGHLLRRVEMTIRQKAKMNPHLAVSAGLRTRGGHCAGTLAVIAVVLFLCRHVMHRDCRA